MFNEDENGTRAVDGAEILKLTCIHAKATVHEYVTAMDSTILLDAISDTIRNGSEVKP